MSRSGSKARWAAIGAALLTVYVHWAAAGGCRYATHGNGVRLPLVLSAAAGTSPESADRNTGQQRSAANAGHVTPASNRPAGNDPLDCAKKYLLQAKKRTEDKPPVGGMTESVRSQIDKNLDDALTSLKGVVGSWPSRNQVRVSLSQSACPATTDLRTALTRAHSEFQLALHAENTTHPAGVDVDSLNEASTDVDAATAVMQAGANTSAAAPTTTTTTDSANPAGQPQLPSCPPAAFLLHIKSVQAFLDQAKGTSSLPQGVSIPLEDASQRLPALEKEWQSLPGNSPCDDSRLRFVKPTGDSDAANLLASAQAYLAEAAIDVATPGNATTQIGKDLQAVLDDIKKAAGSLPSNEHAGQGDASGMILGCAAVVFLLALAVALWSQLRMSTLARQVALLPSSLEKLNSENDQAQAELVSLKGKLEELENKLKQQEAALKQLDNGSHESEGADAIPERERAPKQNAETDPSTLSRVGDSVVAVKVAEPGAARVSAPVVTPAPVRDPVTDYNHIRAMRPAERSERFRALYPSQRKLDCINPSARMSSDPSKIRFKDDALGNLLAVVDGQSALIFPDLTYGYESGRNSLEGVFVYPAEGITSSRVVEAAAAERDGEEWRLTTRGQFSG